MAIKLENPIEVYTDEQLAALYLVYASDPITTHEELNPFRREFRRRGVTLPVTHVDVCRSNRGGACNCAAGVKR